MADEPDRAPPGQSAPQRAPVLAPPTSPEKAPPERAAWFRMTEASSVGIEMVVAVTVCTLAGYYIERYLTHWSPWTTLIGVALGCMTAARAVIRTAKAYERSLREAKERDDQSP